MSAESIYIPIIFVVYLIIMVWYSVKMSKVLNTNLALLIILGLFIPPIWFIFAIISVAYQFSGEKLEVNTLTPRASPVRTKSPEKKSPSRSRTKSPSRSRTKSPSRSRSKSPSRSRSKSPSRSRTKSPSRSRTKSPSRSRSKK